MYVCVCVCVGGGISTHKHKHTHTKGVRRRNGSSRAFCAFLKSRNISLGKNYLTEENLFLSREISLSFLNTKDVFPLKSLITSESCSFTFNR